MKYDRSRLMNGKLLIGASLLKSEGSIDVAKVKLKNWKKVIT